VQQGLQQELLQETEAATADELASEEGATLAAAVGGGEESTAAGTASVGAAGGRGSTAVGQEVPADQVVGLLKQHLGLR
jgi:hypothetical protein